MPEGARREIPKGADNDCVFSVRRMGFRAWRRLLSGGVCEFAPFVSSRLS